MLSGSLGSSSSKRTGKTGTPMSRTRRGSFLGMAQEDLTKRLSTQFHSAANPVRQEQKVAQESVTTFDIIRLAKALDMTAEDVKKARKVFDSLDQNENGVLEYKEFERAVVLMLQEQREKVPVACITALCHDHWAKSDSNRSGNIDFLEFLRWWSTNRFTEELLLSEEERKLRLLAREHGVTVEAIEQVKHCFDTYDADHSGIIDAREFRSVLYRVMRMPPGVELPESRIRHLWQELDRDGSGEAVFEEFLPWWLHRSQTLLPYEGFYRRIRCLKELRPDPPAYPDEPADDG